MAGYVLGSDDQTVMYAVREPHGEFEPNLYVRFHCTNRNEALRLLETYTETILEQMQSIDWPTYVDTVQEVYWHGASTFLLEMAGNGAPRVAHERGHPEIYTEYPLNVVGDDINRDRCTVLFAEGQTLAQLSPERAREVIRGLDNRYKRQNMPTTALAMLRISEHPCADVVHSEALAWAVLHAALRQDADQVGTTLTDHGSAWPPEPRVKTVIDDTVLRHVMLDSDENEALDTSQMLRAMGAHLVPMTTPIARTMFQGLAMDRLLRLMGAALHVTAPGVDNRMRVTMNNQHLMRVWNSENRAKSIKPRIEELVIFDRNYQRLYVQNLQRLRRHASMNLRFYY